jgi:hypothetical protein
MTRLAFFLCCLAIPASAQKRAPMYDGLRLRSVELEREKKRQEILALNRAKFIQWPVLVIPLHHTNIQFNPQNLQPLEVAGTVYPTMHKGDFTLAGPSR